jgi:hypothetical protein
MEFPRLELSVAGVGTFAVVTLDTYAAGEFTPGTTLTSDIPPCQKVRPAVVGTPSLVDQRRQDAGLERLAGAAAGEQPA